MGKAPTYQYICLGLCNVPWVTFYIHYPFAKPPSTPEADGKRDTTFFLQARNTGESWTGNRIRQPSQLLPPQSSPSYPQEGLWFCGCPENHADLCIGLTEAFWSLEGDLGYMEGRGHLAIGSFPWIPVVRVLAYPSWGGGEMGDFIEHLHLQAGRAPVFLI